MWWLAVRQTTLLHSVSRGAHLCTRWCWVLEHQTLHMGTAPPLLPQLSSSQDLSQIVVEHLCMRQSEGSLSHTHYKLVLQVSHLRFIFFRDSFFKVISLIVCFQWFNDSSRGEKKSSQICQTIKNLNQFRQHMVYFMANFHNVKEGKKTPPLRTNTA